MEVGHVDLSQAAAPKHGCSSNGVLWWGAEEEEGKKKAALEAWFSW
jgi:hypothetical protein